MKNADVRIYGPLAKPIIRRYNKFWRDTGYLWAQKKITFTHRAVVFDKPGYVGQSEEGEEWIAQDCEINSLFESLPPNPYLVEGDSKKETRLARLRVTQ